MGIARKPYVLGWVASGGGVPRVYTALGVFLPSTLESERVPEPPRTDPCVVARAQGGGVVATVGPQFTSQMEPAPRTEPGTPRQLGGGGHLPQETLFLRLILQTVITTGLKKNREKRREGNRLQGAVFLLIQAVELRVTF